MRTCRVRRPHPRPAWVKSTSGAELQGGKEAGIPSPVECRPSWRPLGPQPRLFLFSLIPAFLLFLSQECCALHPPVPHSLTCSGDGFQERQASQLSPPSTCAPSYLCSALGAMSHVGGAPALCISVLCWISATLRFILVHWALVRGANSGALRPLLLPPRVSPGLECLLLVGTPELGPG